MQCALFNMFVYTILFKYTIFYFSPIITYRDSIDEVHIYTTTDFCSLLDVQFSVPQIEYPPGGQ